MKKFLSSFLAVTLMLSFVACGQTTGTTVAAYIAVIGTGVETILTLDGINDPKLNQLFTAASTAATNWKPGSVGTEAIEALTDLANNLDLLPLGTKDDQIIAAAINAADNLIVLIQSESKTSSLTEQKLILASWEVSTTPTNTTRRHVYTGKPIKSLKDFKKAFNKLAPKSAKLK